MKGKHVVTGDVGDGLRRAGESPVVGMLRRVDQLVEGAVGSGAGAVFLFAESAEDFAARPLDLLGGEGGVAQHVVQDVQQKGQLFGQALAPERGEMYA